MPRLTATPRNSIGNSVVTSSTAACGIVCLVIAYTATPTTAIYAIGGGASEIDVHMVELVPGKGYIGYETPRMNEIAPHLTRHVNVVALPNRTPYIEGVRLKDAYPAFFMNWA